MFLNNAALFLGMISFVAGAALVPIRQANDAAP